MDFNVLCTSTYFNVLCQPLKLLRLLNCYAKSKRPFEKYGDAIEVELVDQLG